MKKTLIELVNGVASFVRIPKLTSLDEVNNVNANQLISCLNRTAEELSITFPYIEQLRKTTFTADRLTYYDSYYKGYSLDEMTNGMFHRFTTTYLYDITNQRVIPEVKADDKVQLDSLQVGNFPRFFRSGDFLIFTPDLEMGVEVQFYYQTDYVAYIMSGSEKFWKESFDSSGDFSVLDDKLLIRGCTCKYRALTGYPTDRDDAVFDEYLKSVQGACSPGGIIRGYNTDYGYTSGIIDLGIPEF